MMFENVPKEKIPGVEGLLNKTLEGIVANENALDMPRIKTVIERRIQRHMSDTENKPHDTVADSIVGDVLYGNNNDDVRFRKNEKKNREKNSVTFYFFCFFSAVSHPVEQH